jgi:hypothetical protein
VKDIIMNAQLLVVLVGKYGAVAGVANTVGPDMI